MNTLIQYGWTQLRQEQYASYSATELLPARVTSIKGFRYLLITEKGELEAELSGKLLYASAPEELPVVGDWVLFLDYDPSGYIVDVLPRANALTRRQAGTKTGTQVLAANIDHALIVQGLDRDFNPRRIERYLVQITTCGIHAVVILNKSDLVANPADFVKQVQALKRDCPIFTCSTLTGDGIPEIRSCVLQAGKTSILIGSSGAGKSSLLNAFTSNALQPTASLSTANRKGKHTTTTRDLFVLDNQSLIIDSPGMREFGLTSEEGLPSHEMFPAIAALSTGCRFSDCSHMNETGCAVLEALRQGELDENTYISYVKLIKEQKHFNMSVMEKKRLGKQGGKMVREAKGFKKRLKG